MNPQPGQPPALVHLTTEEEKEILGTIAYIKNHSHAVSRQESAEIDQVLHTLAGWKMPARVFYLLCAYLLQACQVPFPEGRRVLHGPEVRKAAEQAAGLLAPVVLPSDKEDRKRILRANRLRDLFAQSYADPEVVLLVVARHVVRMRSAEPLDYNQKRLIYEENEAVFLPLLEHLGIWSLRRELGNISLQFLNPRKLWSRIDEGQKQHRARQEGLSAQIRQQLEAEVKKEGVTAEISLDPTTPSSVYRRILRGDALLPLLRQVRFKVVVNNEEDCYRILRLIHRLWEPLYGRTNTGEHFRDLVSSPKYNGYRSLVTQVSYAASPATPIEFHIVTREMSEGNSLGIIAFKYLFNSPNRFRTVWWEDQPLKDFLQERPAGSSTPQIYVFSPTGKVYRGLPAGSTPIDYAYHIHSEVGNHAKRIWVNGQPARYDQRLLNGDLVEIEVDQNYQGPDPRWLKAVRTRTARSRIKSSMKKTDLPAGRQIIDRTLNRELQLYQLQNDVTPKYIDKFIEATARFYGYSDTSAFYLDIAEPNSPGLRSRISVERLVSRLITRYLVDHIARADGDPLPPYDKIRFVHCEHGPDSQRVCPGTQMVGKLERRQTKAGEWVERLYIYRADCPDLPKARAAGKTRVELEWLGDRRKGEPFHLVIEAVDRPGLLDQILKIIYSLYEQKMYLLALNAEVQPDCNARITMIIDAQGKQAMQALNEQFTQAKRAGLIHEFQFDALSPIEKIRLRSADTIPNPFTTGPARSPQIFKGRDYEITKILNAIHNGHRLIVLFGINRVGKTSLMQFLQHHITTEHTVIPAFMDMQGLTRHDEQTFWNELARVLVNAVRAQVQQKNLTIHGYPFRGKDNTYEAFLHLWKDLQTVLQGRRILVMIDEFSMVDEHWNNPREAERLVTRLKSLVENEESLSWLLCVQETLYRQVNNMRPATRPSARSAAGHAARIASPPLLRTGIHLHLEYLDQAAARRLVEEPVGQMLKFDEEVIQRILWLTACHPYFLQNLMHEIVDQSNADRQTHITAERLDKAVAQLLKLEILFHSFTRAFDDDGAEAHGTEPRGKEAGGRPAGVDYLEIIAAMAALSGKEVRPVLLDTLARTLRAGGSSTSGGLNAGGLNAAGLNAAGLNAALNRLCEAGLVKRHIGTGQPIFSIRVPLFREWLVLNHPYTLPA